MTENLISYLIEADTVVYTTQQQLSAIDDDGIHIIKNADRLVLLLSAYVIEVQFLLAAMLANPVMRLQKQSVGLRIRFNSAHIVDISRLAMRLAHYDYADRARAVAFLPWIHGAKVTVFMLATPRDTHLFL